MNINPTPEEAWSLYLDIDKTVKQSKQMKEAGGFDYGLKMALQRLCQAVLIQYNLKKDGYPEVVYHNQPLDVRSIRQLNLSTTRAMVDARIVEWEQAKEVSHYVGTDDDAPGDDDYVTRILPAAFRPQKSIQNWLNIDYFEERARQNATAAGALALYSRIDRCAREEMRRISCFTITFQKDTEINLALQRLSQAILQKYNLPKPDEVEFTTEIDANKVNSLELYSINSMLDAKVFVRKQGESLMCMSLRQILNISRLNPLNIFCYQEAYWGQSTALVRFEQSINADQELALIN